MDEYEKLLNRVSDLYFRRERKEEAKKLFYLRQDRNRTAESRSSDEWYHTPESPQPGTGGL